MVMDSTEKLIDYYRACIAEALTRDQPEIHTLEAYAACMSMALRLIATLPESSRSELCGLVEVEFRNDVEMLAKSGKYRSFQARIN